MKKIVFSILLSLTIPFIAMAQGNDALPFTVINHNPGSVGDAAYSAFSNAAELAFSEKTLDAAASYQYWAPSASGTSYVNAAVAYKFSSSFGMSLGFSVFCGPTTSLATTVSSRILSVPHRRWYHWVPHLGWVRNSLWV